MKNVEIVQGIYAAFGRGDVPAILAVQRADATWVIAGQTPYSGSYRGAAEILQFFQNLVGAAEMLAFEPQQFLDAGATVIVLGRENMIAKTTGKQVENRWAHVWTMVDGKVSSFEEFLDSGAIERAFA